MTPRTAINFEGTVILVNVMNSFRVLLETIEGISKMMNGQVKIPIKTLITPPILAQIPFPLARIPSANSEILTPIRNVVKSLRRMNVRSSGTKWNVFEKS